jgi:hypothetical protein
MDSIYQTRLNARYGQWSLFLFLALLAPCLLILTPDLVWDDKTIIDWHAHPNAPALFGVLSIGWEYWRPLGVLSIVLPHLLGVPTQVNKGISLLLFAATGWMLLSFHVRTATGSVKTTALLLALFLALSPVFAEAIIWLSARFDLLLTFFVSGLLLRHFVLARQPVSAAGGKRYLAEGLVWALALGLTKETGSAWALGIAAILALDGVRCSMNRQLVRLASGLVLGTALTLALRMVAFSVFEHPSAAPDTGPGAYFPLFAEALTREIVLLVAPYLDRAPVHAPGWGVPWLVYPLSVILPALTVAAALMSFRRIRTPEFREWAWATLAGAALIGHAAVTPLHDPALGQLICARYVAPSAAVLLALAMTALAGSRGKAHMAGMGLAVLVVGGAVPFAADNKIAWSSNSDLWTRTWQHGSHIKLAAVNLTEAYMQAGKPGEALRISREWLKSHPDGGEDNCRFVETIATLDTGSQDTQNLLRDFIPYAWCLPSLARKTVALLDADRTLCPAILRMAHRADDLGKAEPSPSADHGTQDALIAAQALADATNKCGVSGS